MYIYLKCVLQYLWVYNEATCTKRQVDHLQHVKNNINNGISVNFSTFVATPQSQNISSSVLTNNFYTYSSTQAKAKALFAKQTPKQFVSVLCIKAHDACIAHNNNDDERGLYTNILVLLCTRIRLSNRFQCSVRLLLYFCIHVRNAILEWS